MRRISLAWISMSVAWPPPLASVSYTHLDPPPAVEHHGHTVLVEHGQHVEDVGGFHHREFPFGFGGAVEIVPGWVSLDLEAAAGPVLNKSGPATSMVRTIDGSGQTRDVGALPSITATFVGAFGFSVIL